MEQKKEVLLTTKEAGLVTGVSSTTIRRWLKKGKIPSFMANTKGLRLRYMVSEKVLRDLLAKRVN